MAQKKIDSTVRKGRAEQYIIDATYDKFWRNGRYEPRTLKGIEINEIQKKYHLKGFVFGNYVTQEERHFFLYKTSKQLEFIAKLKGNNNIGHEELTIGFGADGMPNSLAHFNAKDLYINLNRGKGSGKYLDGESSLIHEYGHYIDYRLGRSIKASNYNFASEEANATPAMHYYTFVQKAVEDVDYMNTLDGLPNARYYKSRIEIFARNFESSIGLIVKDYPSYKKYFDKKFDDERYLSEKKIKKYGLDRLVKTILKQTK